MKKYIIWVLIIISYVSVSAQTTDTTKTDSTLNRWIPTFVTGLNISQIAFSNWTKGGDNAISWTLTGDFNAQRKSTSWIFKTQLKGAYGRTKLGGNDFRTNDNDLYFDFVAAYNVGWAVNPYISNSIRTQITEGFDYSKDTTVKIADFFDPGYVTQSLGFTYDKLKNFNTRLGIATQETFTNKFRQYSDDPDTKDKKEAFKLETGIESVSNAELVLDDNLLLKTKFRLFSRFERLEVWDVRWDNTITAKVNSWLNVNFTFLMIYEKDQSPTAQMKQALQLGIVYNIL